MLRLDQATQDVLTELQFQKTTISEEFDSAELAGAGMHEHLTPLHPQFCVNVYKLME